MAELLDCPTRQAKKSSQVVILLFVQYGIEFDPSQIKLEPLKSFLFSFPIIPGNTSFSFHSC